MKQSARHWERGVFYVGSYGAVDEATIHVCRMDKSTGQLTVLQKYSGVGNASFLALHPEGRRLYGVEENAETSGVYGGAVTALAVAEESGLLGEITGSVLTGGAHPCYVHAEESGKALLIANYSGGSVTVVPLEADGALTEQTLLLRHAGASGAVPSRQEAPHAHSIVPLRGTAFFYAADLGLDAIVVYRFDQSEQSLTQIQLCPVPGGYGPRHLVFHPHLPVAYATCELASQVALLRVDRDTGILTYEESYSSIPSDYDGCNDAADIHLSPDGRFLYSSNRGHNSIAVFAVDERGGQLNAVQHMFSGGEQPRNFGITPEGDFLLAANQKSGSICLFAIHQPDGTLAPTDIKLEISSPVCVRFGSN